MAGTFIFLGLLFFSILITAKSTETHCELIKCSNNEPEIHFPFHLQTYQPPNCGLSGYQLFCQENTTMIHIPRYGNLVVKSISYDRKRLDLLDPGNCVHEVFLNLNLSSTPFGYYYVVKRFTYLNCSTRLPSSFKEVPCLSGANHHVYTVESTFAAPESCWSVKSVEIPYSYSPYLDDNSFGLGLTWKLPQLEDPEPRTRFLKRGYWVYIEVVVCMMVAMIISVYLWTHHSKAAKEDMENLKLLGIS